MDWSKTTEKNRLPKFGELAIACAATLLIAGAGSWAYKLNQARSVDSEAAAVAMATKSVVEGALAGKPAELAILDSRVASAKEALASLSGKSAMLDAMVGETEDSLVMKLSSLESQSRSRIIGAGDIEAALREVLERKKAGALTGENFRGAIDKIARDAKSLSPLQPRRGGYSSDIAEFESSLSELNRQAEAKLAKIDAALPVLALKIQPDALASVVDARTRQARFDAERFALAKAEDTLAGLRAQAFLAAEGVYRSHGSTFGDAERAELGDILEMDEEWISGKAALARVAMDSSKRAGIVAGNHWSAESYFAGILAAAVAIDAQSAMFLSPSEKAMLSQWAGAESDAYSARTPFYWARQGCSLSGVAIQALDGTMAWRSSLGLAVGARPTCPMSEKARSVIDFAAKTLAAAPIVPLGAKKAPAKSLHEMGGWSVEAGKAVAERASRLKSMGLSGEYSSVETLAPASGLLAMSEAIALARSAANKASASLAKTAALRLAAGQDREKNTDKSKPKL